MFKDKNGEVRVGKIVLVIAIVLIVLIGVFSSFKVVPTGYTGVRMTFGQVSDTAVKSGINFKIPFVQDIELVNNKQQDLTDTMRIWSETAERTAIYYEGVTVTYQINPDFSTWIYAHVTNFEENLVSSTLIASAVKSCSKQLSDVDATNRGIVEPMIFENLQKSLDEKYQENAIEINKVTVANIDFDESYNNAIAAKQKAQIEAEQQAIENKRAIDKAQADATVLKTEAQAKAEALLIEAEAEAKANETLQKSLTDEVLRSQYIEKWDGELPQYVAGDGAGVMVDLTGGAEK